MKDSLFTQFIRVKFEVEGKVSSSRTAHFPPYYVYVLLR